MIDELGGFLGLTSQRLPEHVAKTEEGIESQYVREVLNES